MDAGPEKQTMVKDQHRHPGFHRSLSGSVIMPTSRIYKMAWKALGLPAQKQTGLWVAIGSIFFNARLALTADTLVGLVTEFA